MGRNPNASRPGPAEFPHSFQQLPRTDFREGRQCALSIKLSAYLPRIGGEIGFCNTGDTRAWKPASCRAERLPDRPKGWDNAAPRQPTDCNRGTNTPPGFNPTEPHHGMYTNSCVLNSTTHRSASARTFARSAPAGSAAGSIPTGKRA